MKQTIRVPVRDLKNNLSAYLRQVRTGQRIVITSHGRPVGQLNPPPSEETEDEVLARILSMPEVIAGTGERLEGAQSPIRAKRGERLSEILLERE